MVCGKCHPATTSDLLRLGTNLTGIPNFLCSVGFYNWNSHRGNFRYYGSFLSTINFLSKQPFSRFSQPVLHYRNFFLPPCAGKSTHDRHIPGRHISSRHEDSGRLERKGSGLLAGGVSRSSCPGHVISSFTPSNAQWN